MSEGGAKEVELTPKLLFEWIEENAKEFKPKWYHKYEDQMETVEWKCKHLWHFLVEIAVKNYLIKNGYPQIIWDIPLDTPFGLTELITMLYSLCKIPKNHVLNMIAVLKARGEITQEDRILFKEDEEEFWRCVEEKRNQKRKGKRAPEEKCLNELRIPSTRVIIAHGITPIKYCLEYIFWKYYVVREPEISAWNEFGKACFKILEKSGMFETFLRIRERKKRLKESA